MFQFVKLYQNLEKKSNLLTRASYKRIILLSGGYIGVELAQTFESWKEVVLIDIIDTILVVTMTRTSHTNDG